jgi:hypothetical protein
MAMVERISSRARTIPAGTWALSAGLGLTVVLGLLLPEAARAGGATALPAAIIPKDEASEAVRWGFLIGVGLDVAVLAIAWVTNVKPLKVIIGTDNRISTSKTVATIWTLVVAAALLAFVYANAIGHPHPLDVTNEGGRVGQYALLFGGSVAAAILAKTIVGKQTGEAGGERNSAASPQLRNLIANDEGETDLGDLQYVLFNMVALIYVLTTMLLHEPANGLPHIPDVLLGLTSVSATGYVGKKLLPPPAAATAVIAPPVAGAARSPVTVTVEGVAKPKGAEATFRVLFGPGDKGQTIGAPVSPAGQAIFQVDASPEPAPAALPASLPVTVITEGATLLEAGNFTIE